MSSPAPGIALPAILIANDLRDGDVVVRAAAGWSRDPREAVIAHDRAAAERLAAEAAAELAANRVVDAYLIDVTLGAAGEPVPNHFRERVKLRGPSIRPDLARVPGQLLAGART
jgi:sulfite reductase (NADPH) hemoprotein beta-component